MNSDQSITMPHAFGMIAGEQLYALRAKRPELLGRVPVVLAAAVIEGALIEVCLRSDILRDRVQGVGGGLGITREESAWRAIEIECIALLEPTLARLRGDSPQRR